MPGQAQPTLMDLIAANSGQGGQYGAPPPDTPAPAPSPQDQQDALTAQAFAPNPAMPPEKKLNIGQRLALALANGLGTYGSAIRGGPPVDYLGKKQAQLDQERQRQYGQLLSDVGASREKARFELNHLLSEKDKQQMRADELQGRKELQKATIDQQNVALAQAKDLAQQQHAQAMQLEQVRQQGENQRAQAKNALESHLAGISKKIADGDKEAQRQQEALGKAMAYIGGTADNIPAMLKGDPTNGVPPMTIEQVETKYKRALDAMTQIGLVGDARKAANAYYLQEIGPTLSDAHAAQLQAQFGAGPEQPGPPGSPADQALSGGLSQVGRALGGLVNPYPNRP